MLSTSYLYKRSVVFSASYKCFALLQECSANKKVWERFQKNGHFKTASNVF